MTAILEKPIPSERSLTRPDGRRLAWVGTGSREGRPLLRLPGTPGSRHLVRADQTPWLERDLRVIVTERPGFGASSAHSRRTIVDHADDLAAILDELHIDRVPVIGTSGAAPYVLALAERHPDRVQAATIVVGAAPLTDEEAAQLIGLNAESHRLATAGDREGMTRLLSPVRESLLADPLGGFRETMRTAPPSDHEIMDDAGWQVMIERGLKEALRAGVDGWVDESMLLVAGWRELDVTAVRTSLTWWHGDQDRNAPLAAVRRLISHLPHAQLVIWPNAGHLLPYREEGRILDELLTRS